MSPVQRISFARIVMALGSFREKVSQPQKLLDEEDDTKLDKDS
jgi:hypothetical protein